MGEHGEEATHIAVFPCHDGGVVAVKNTCNRVAVVEHGIDVTLVGGDDGRIGKENLEVSLAIPCKMLADATTAACSTVADEGDDETDVVSCGHGEGVVGSLKGSF